MSAAASVRLEPADGVVHLVLDAPGRSANVMDDAYGAAMTEAVGLAEGMVRDDRRAIRGVVIRSAKETFFAGGDLDAMIARPRTPQAWRWRLEQVQQPLRALEGLPVPVVAAINGAAVGGGLEIALAGHARVALAGDHPLGLPEVTLGVLAAGGGISRTVRLLGLRRALEEVLLPGATVDPATAHRLGLVDRLVERDVVAAALAALDDVPRHRFPRARDRDDADRSWLAALRARVEHGVADAPKALLRAAVAGAGCSALEAQRHEVEAFLSLVGRPQLGLVLRTAYAERRGVLRSIPREPPSSAPPETTRFEIVTDSGLALPAARFGPDLRRGVVEVVVPAEASTDDVDQARRTVRGWGGCPVVARGTSYVASLDRALRAEVAHARRDGVAEEVLGSALLRLGMTLPDVAMPPVPLPVDDLSERLAVAVSLASLAALATGRIDSVAEADLASVAALGFPAALGGAVGHALHHVVDDRVVGVDGFVLATRRLARHHGDRFALRPGIRAVAHQLADQEEPP